MFNSWSKVYTAHLCLQTQINNRGKHKTDGSEADEGGGVLRLRRRIRFTVFDSSSSSLSLLWGSDLITYL
jgi:hypothetical protein